MNKLQTHVNKNNGNSVFQLLHHTTENVKLIMKIHYRKIGFMIPDNEEAKRSFDADTLVNELELDIYEIARHKPK